MKITLLDLPKVSLNDIYASKHWQQRKKYKDAYTLIIRSQFNKKLKGEFELVEYEFNFKSRPLDCSNCVYMAKMIEDIIFENDSYKLIKSIKISSKKSNNNCVIITV